MLFIRLVIFLTSLGLVATLRPPHRHLPKVPHQRLFLRENTRSKTPFHSKRRGTPSLLDTLASK